MTVNRQQLKQLLTTHNVSADQAQQAVADLEDLFQQVESGKFIFGDDPDEFVASWVIGMATGKEVQKIVFLSAAQLHSETESLFGNLQLIDFSDRLRSRLAPDRWRSIEISSAMLHLRSDLEDSLRSSLGHDLWIIHRELYDLCFARLGFTFTNDDTQAAKLGSSIRFAAKNPIIGEKIDEPGTWFILKA
ncbi:MAG: hypothetical protein WCT10_05315 [Patescibacteria group bacterium]|jgi:hypothetical protein